MTDSDIEANTPPTDDQVIESTGTEVEPDPGSVEGIQHVNWQAPEYRPEDRPLGWYLGFVGLTLVFMTLAVLVIRSWSFALVVAAAAAALIVYAKRPPRIINYTLSSKGLHVDDELKPIDQYKAFGVRRDGDMFILALLPTKRFMPSLTAFFPEDKGEEIVDVMSAQLPMQEIKPDIVDKLVRKLRL